PLSSGCTARRGGRSATRRADRILARPARRTGAARAVQEPASARRRRARRGDPRTLRIRQGDRAGPVHSSGAHGAQSDGRRAGSADSCLHVVAGGRRVSLSLGVTLAGYGLGSSIPSIDKYLLPIIAVIVLVSLSPLAIELLRRRRAGASEPVSHARHAASEDS